MADTATILWQSIREQGICPGKRSLEEWRAIRIARMRVGPWQIPVLPLTRRMRESLVLHDVHHVLTGYDTGYRGEAALAVWELASGGCGRSLFFWLDRITFVLLGLLICPRSLPQAFRRGRKARNLYGWSPDEVLATPFESLRRSVAG